MPKTDSSDAPQAYQSVVLTKEPVKVRRVTLSTSLPGVAPTKVVVAATVTTVLAMALVPTDAIGIGIALTGVAVLAAVFTASPERPTVPELITAAGIVALLLVSGWRSAGWLAAVCTAIAILATGTLVVGARTIREMAAAVVAPIVAVVPTAAWLGRGIADGARDRPVKNLGAILQVAVVTVVLLVVFGALFAGADATFESLLSTVLPDVGDTEVGPSVVLGLVIGGATAIGIYLRYARPRLADRSPRMSAEPWMWAVPTGTVLVLYIAFLITQARAMFGGDDYVQETAGLTYADYARTGFWQLFAVTALTILVVSIAWQRADRSTSVGRVLTRTILGGLCIAALAVVASALHRMDLYMDTFGATRLRVGVMATELWLGAVLVALIIAGAGLGTRQLPRALGFLTMVAALSFAAYNPDERIAQANVDRFERTGKVDLIYLASLSPDATEALLGLPVDLHECVLVGIERDLADEHGPTAFNVGRHEAREALDGREPGSSAAPVSCAPR